MLSTVSGFALSCQPCHVNVTDVSLTYTLCCTVTRCVPPLFSFWPSRVSGTTSASGLLAAGHSVCRSSDACNLPLFVDGYRYGLGSDPAPGFTRDSIQFTRCYRWCQPLFSSVVVFSCFVFCCQPLFVESYIFPFVPDKRWYAAGTRWLTISPLIHDPVFVYRHSMLHHTGDTPEFPLNRFNRLPPVFHPFRLRHRIIHVLR